MQGVGRRKRGGTGEGGSDDLISARCHSKYSAPSLSLSLSVQQTHTDTQWLNLCQYEVRSPSLSPCTTATFISSPCTCVCVRHSQLFLPDIPQQMWDWLLGYRNRESHGNILWICAFLKLLWIKPSVLFFFQTFGWSCWETASLHRLCYWNFQFLWGF